MDSISLKELFRKKDLFVIPAYQRAYSWQRPQRMQLIEDIKESKGHYYLGHYLFEMNTENPDEYSIIDGQQRMTTMVIFFSCMVHELQKRKDAKMNVNSLKRVYLHNDNDEQRFKTVEYDDPLFRGIIIDRDEDSKIELSDSVRKSIDSFSQKNIIDCRDYFDEEFKKQETEVLEQWIKIVEQARVTFFEVESKIDAAQIFAFQNDRGKALTNLEVLKSYIMLQIYVRGEKKQKELINSLEEAFRIIYRVIVKLKTPEDFVLRYFWMAYGQRGFHTEDPIAEMKALLKIKDIKKYPEFLMTLSKAYEQVQTIEESKDAVIVNLRRENNMAWSLPVLIKASVISNVKENTLRCLYALLENFTFRAMVRGGRASEESRLNKLIEGAKDDSSFIDRIRLFIADLKTGYWNDGQFKQALSNGQLYGRNKACSYLLWRYEETLFGQGYTATLYSIADETLEHIAPQTERNEKIASGYGIYNDPEDINNGIESGEWLNSIGNLMLASRSHNSSLGNKPFKDKLKSYHEASLLMQQKEVCDMFPNGEDNPIWDKDKIEQRGKKIIKAAQEIWSIKRIEEMVPDKKEALF